METKNQSTIFVLLACLLWGCGYPFWKLVLVDIGFLHMVAICAPSAAILLFLLLRIRPSELAQSFRTHWVCFLGLSCFGGILGTVLVFYALSNLSTGATSVLEKLQPVFTVVLAWYFLAEYLSKKAIIFGLCAIICSILIALPDIDLANLSSGSVLPLFAGIGSAMGYGTATVFARAGALNGAKASHMAFFRMSISGAFFLTLFILLQGLDSYLKLSAQTAYLLIALIVGPYSLAFFFYFKGLANLKAGVANLFELCVPVIALLTGVVFLGEEYSNFQLIIVPLFLFCTWQVLANTSPK